MNLEKLKGHVPDSVIAQIPDTCAKFNITTPLRLAHFLSQCAHESGGFKAVSENLNYSSDGLKKIFPKYFPGNLSESYARQPEKMLHEYMEVEWVMGMNQLKKVGNTVEPGYLQTTGKENYKKLGDFLGVDLLSNPELVATKYPLASAAFFFNNNGLWSICDKGADDATVTAVTKRVNGGVIGLEHRLSEFKKFISLLS